VHGYAGTRFGANPLSTCSTRPAAEVGQNGLQAQDASSRGGTNAPAAPKGFDHAPSPGGAGRQKLSVMTQGPATITCRSELIEAWQGVLRDVVP
jgi:hypothetical protein